MNPTWKQAMDQKIDALLSRENQDLVIALLGCDIVGCKWIQWANIRPGLWSKGSLKLMELSTLRFSLWLQLNFICPFLHCCNKSSSCSSKMYKKHHLVWWSSRRSLYGATSRVCGSKGEYCV